MPDETWKEGLPEAVRSWKEVETSNSPEEFWGQMTNHRAHLGQSIRVPGEGAGEADWTEFHTKLKNKVPNLIPRPTDEAGYGALYDSLGRPATPEEYTNPLGGTDSAEVVALRKTAHELGFSQKQFENLITNGDAQATALAETTKLQQDEALQGLKTEWGAAFEQKKQRAASIAEKTGAPQGLIDAINNDTIGPESMKWFDSLAEKFKSAPGVGDDFNHKDPVMTPDEAAIKISEITGNKEGPYWNKQDPAHAVIKAKVRELYIVKQGKNYRPQNMGAFPVGG